MRWRHVLAIGAVVGLGGCSGGEAAGSVSGRLLASNTPGAPSEPLGGRVEVHERTEGREQGPLVEAQDVEAGKSFTFSLAPGDYTLTSSGGRCLTPVRVEPDERTTADLICPRR